MRIASAVRVWFGTAALCGAGAGLGGPVALAQAPVAGPTVRALVF